MKYLFFLSVCLAVLFACSKTTEAPQANNIYVQPVSPVTIKIDTVINYTPVYYPWVGSQKTFDFPVLDGIINPVISVYYKVANQTSWKILPDGFTAWFVRIGKIVVVYVRLLTTEISVKIAVAW